MMVEWQKPRATVDPFFWQADYDLFTQYFNDDKLDSDMYPSDSILIEPADDTGASSRKWTDQETLLLLETLELCSENWSEIFEHIAENTKAPCILHFVQMPTEDTFRDYDDEDDESHKEKTEKKDTSPDADSEKKKVGSSTEENADKVNSDVKRRTRKPHFLTIPRIRKKLRIQKMMPHGPSSNEQHEFSPMDITESVDLCKLKVNQEGSKETSVNVAVKALREAFDAMGIPD